MKPLVSLAVSSVLALAPFHALGDLCPPGTFSVDGQDPCSPCSAGTYAAFPGSTACEDCEPHTVSDEGSSQCEGCAYPFYQPLAGQGGCVRRNDYSCWTVRDLGIPARFAPIEDAPASDAFSNDPVSLSRPSLFCGAATIESGFGGPHADARWCCYKASRTTPAEPVVLQTSSILGGDLQLRVAKRAFVCDQCFGSPETQQTRQCWKVKDTGNPKFQPYGGVRVFDEFAFDFMQVRKPALVCAPASVAGSPLTDVSGYQCCYRVGKAYVSEISRSVEDPSGAPLELGVMRRSMLCEVCTASALP